MGQMGKKAARSSRRSVPAEAADNGGEKASAAKMAAAVGGGVGLFLAASKTRRFPDLRPISF